MTDQWLPDNRNFTSSLGVRVVSALRKRPMAHEPRVTIHDSDSDFDSQKEAELASSEDGCCCLHCTDTVDVANQPTDLDGSKSRHGKQSYSRCIQLSWYEKYPWISVFTKAYKIYCKPNLDLIPSRASFSSVFAQKGFCN